MEVWRGLLPGHREQETGFLPARENRSRAWACTRNQPRACAVQMQTQTRYASCPPQVGRTFSSYLSPFSVWLLPLKILFTCRSGRDGDFLACSLPRLCSRPAGLVTCCFFADFCAHCLFACRALCFGCLFICLCCLRGFSLLFFTLSCLTSSSQTSFHLSLRPRRASTFFRKESRQRFARGRGSAPFEPPFQRPAADLPFPRAAGRLKRPFGPQTAGR